MRTPVVMMPPGFIVPRLLDLVMIPMDPRQDRRDEEEDAIHDTKRPAGLEHRARLVRVDIQRIDTPTQKAKVVIGVAAVDVLDEAQVVHAGDEGAHEAEVDEPDEARVGAAAVVREEREERPGEREDRDDEEDQDVVWRQLVGVVVDMHEGGEHAHGGDLCNGNAVSLVRGLKVGRRSERQTKVMISMKRQKAKKIANIIVNTLCAASALHWLSDW